MRERRRSLWELKEGQHGLGEDMEGVVAWDEARELSHIEDGSDKSQSGLREMRHELVAVVYAKDERTVTLETETGNQNHKILSK